MCCWNDNDENSNEKYNHYNSNKKNPIVCDAAYDKITRLLCSYWGYVIPLIPLVLNTFFDLIFTHIDNNNNHNSNNNNNNDDDKNKIKSCVTDPRVRSAWTSHFLRVLVYVTIFIFRTVVLYMIADMIQYELQAKPDEGITISIIIIVIIIIIIVIIIIIIRNIFLVTFFNYYII